MNKENIYKAINQTAKDLGLKHFIEVNDICFVPSALFNLASLMWVKKFPENKNTKLIREQLLNLNEKGKLVFN